MKKTYEKPMAYFEDMSFDTAIADVCTAVIVDECKSNNFGLDCVAYKIPGDPFGFTYFDEEKIVCNAFKYCYHVSAGVQNLS